MSSPATRWLPSLAARREPLLAAAVLLAVAGFLVSRQPVGSPWWVYADSDAPYVASGLNLMIGEKTKYFDHPGLPLQQLIALTFRVRLAVAGPDVSPREYAGRLLLDLDATRPYYRTYAIAIYLGGSLLVLALLWSLFGRWSFALTGGLLWLAAPGLLPMSIQYRADPLLAILVLAAATIVARAARARDPLAYLAAAVVTGFALTVKYSAIVLVVPLALALLWRHPGEESLRAARDGARTVLHRYRWLALGAIAAWVAAAVALNLTARALHPSAKQLAAAAAAVVLPAAWLAASLRLRRLDPFAAALLCAGAAGVLVPVTLTLSDGFQMLIWLGRDFVGRGSDIGVAAFHGIDWSRFVRYPAFVCLPVLACALLAALDGLRRRRAEPVLLAAGAAAGLLLTLANFKSVYYLAPVYMLAIPGALWFARLLGRLAPAALAALAAVAVVPQLVHADDARNAARDEERVSTAAVDGAATLLRSQQVALTPIGFSTADARFAELVRPFVVYVPRYRYRLLPVDAAGSAPGLEPALYATTADGVPDSGSLLDLGAAGAFRTGSVAASRGPIEFVRLRRVR